MIKNGDHVLYRGQQCKVICAMKLGKSMMPIVLIPGEDGSPGRAIQVERSELNPVQSASSPATQDHRESNGNHRN